MKKQISIIAALLVVGALAAAVVPSLAQDASSSAPATAPAAFDCASASSDMSAMSSDASFMSQYSEACASSSTAG